MDNGNTDPAGTPVSDPTTAVDPNAPVAPTDQPATDPMGTPAPEVTPEAPQPEQGGGDQGEQPAV